MASKGNFRKQTTLRPIRGGESSFFFLGQRTTDSCLLSLLPSLICRRFLCQVPSHTHCCRAPYFAPFIGFLSLRLVHLIPRISLHHSHQIRSRHLSLPRSFNSDFVLVTHDSPIGRPIFSKEKINCSVITPVVISSLSLNT